MKKLLNALPLIAPFPEGYAVFAALVSKLNWPPAVAALAALVVALTGFFALQVAGIMAEHNHGLKKSEQEFRADMKAPYLAVVIWFVGSSLLILFLDAEIVKAAAPIALVIVGGSGSYIGSLHYAQERRAVDLKEHRSEQQQERKQAAAERRAAKQQPAAASSKPAAGKQQKGSKPQQAVPSPLQSFACSYHSFGCARTFPTQKAANAHSGRCQYRPTIAPPQVNASTVPNESATVRDTAKVSQ